MIWLLFFVSHVEVLNEERHLTTCSEFWFRAREPSLGEICEEESRGHKTQQFCCWKKKPFGCWDVNGVFLVDVFSAVWDIGIWRKMTQAKQTVGNLCCFFSIYVFNWQWQQEMQPIYCSRCYDRWSRKFSEYESVIMTTSSPPWRTRSECNVNCQEVCEVWMLTN